MSKFTRIKAPKYRIGRHVLNEYELRCLQVEVAKGLKKPGIEVKDDAGQIAIIQADGSMDIKGIAGYDIASKYVLDLIALRRDKQKAFKQTLINQQLKSN